MKYLSKNIKAILVSVIVLSFLASCQEDDSLTRRGKPGISITEKTITVIEGETATFNLSLDYAVQNKLDIRIEPLDENDNPIPVTEPDGDPNSGNGYIRLDFEDFNVPYGTWFEGGYFNYGYQGGTGYIVTYPAYTKDFQIDIETIRDIFPENTKTFKFRLSATSLIEAVLDEVITLNIENYVGTELITTFSWDGDYVNDACGDLDLDLELYLNGVFTNFSYSNCPESLTISGSDTDGTYTLDASLWTTNGVTNPDNINIPATINFAKPGVFNETVDLSSLFPLNDGGLDDGNPNAITTFTIVKSGTTYLITNSSNSTIATGRESNYRISLNEKRELKK
ncbi:hypothetical protein FIA58_010220 [Flavobacterium jejuense]|uniref:DUF4493 domain-containing protein n=1 Tax=Flavobacterium jejuense TaxID=1544455 RepID=A0ABX0ISI0_9FLAO|nr:hypothetical protein [Flavobacterium jejuense]NHN26050.1 hypothetical protein [Flavobacterium jejuense]